ncbi:MAG: 3-phosphoshikimate 1-carboxyvinyltransferase, partial [Planctomycetes bacterium]|nr:3-phosphoshikimate 1-carboxyvinyltransferase [Planctomycetota bacterium]
MGPVHATVRPPGSKSITNRALICAALADGRSVLKGALDSEDTRVMVQALRELGWSPDWNKELATIAIEGSGGTIPRPGADLFVANSGTTMRFLCAALTAGIGRYRLDGVDRMRARPIGDLLDALNALGADARAEFANGCPPVLVDARGLPG